MREKKDNSGNGQNIDFCDREMKMNTNVKGIGQTHTGNVTNMEMIDLQAVAEDNCKRMGESRNSKGADAGGNCPDQKRYGWRIRLRNITVYRLQGLAIAFAGNFAGGRSRRLSLGRGEMRSLIFVS
jgi:hypothetical protein